jgi:hypothetical protein
VKLHACGQSQKYLRMASQIKFKWCKFLRHKSCEDLWIQANKLTKRSHDAKRKPLLTGCVTMCFVGQLNLTSQELTRAS